MPSPAAVVLPVLLVWAVAPGPDQVVFRFQDPAVVESSGLVVQDGRFVTVNDSGNPPVLFGVDPVTGRTRETVEWGEQNVDAEALAPASDGDVWVGDIGDNDADRSTISVTRVGIGDGSEPEAYRLAYPDGSHDAETLLADPVGGRLLVVTKGLLGGEVYAAPKVLDPQSVNRLTPVGRVLGVATDGAFLPDGRHVILRDYSRAVVYGFPDLEPVGEFDLPPQPQGEALAVDSDGSIYVGSEGVGTPVYRVELPDRVARAIAPDPGRDPVPPSVPPSGQTSGQGSAEPADQPTTRSSDGPGEGPGHLGSRAWAIIVLAVAAAAGGLGLRQARRRKG